MRRGGGGWRTTPEMRLRAPQAEREGRFEGANGVGSYPRRARVKTCAEVERLLSEMDGEQQWMSTL